MRFREVRVTGWDGKRVSALWLCFRRGVSAATMALPWDGDQTVPTVLVLFMLKRDKAAPAASSCDGYGFVKASARSGGFVPTAACEFPALSISIFSYDKKHG